MNATIALSLNFSIDYLKPFLKSFNDKVDGELFLITDLTLEQIPVKSNNIHIVNFSELAKKYKIAKSIGVWISEYTSSSEFWMFLFLL